MASTRSIPTAQQGPAQLNHFPINKTADSGWEDFLRSAPPFAHCISGKKMCGKRWGLLFSSFFTAHLFAGSSAKFLKTCCITYRANITLSLLPSQPFAHCISGKKMCGKRWGLLFSAVRVH